MFRSLEALHIKRVFYRKTATAVRSSHMRHDSRVRPSLDGIINRLAAEHEASVMLMTCRVYHHIIVMPKTLAMHAAAGRTIFVMFVEYYLRRKPPFAPATLNAVVVNIHEYIPSRCINRDVIKHVAKVRMAREANNAFRESSSPTSSLFNRSSRLLKIRTSHNAANDFKNWNFSPTTPH